MFASLSCLLALVSLSCGQKGRAPLSLGGSMEEDAGYATPDESPEPALLADAMDAEGLAGEAEHMARGPAPPSPAGGNGDAKKEKDRKATAPVKTWKRAESTPNASRLMVGDKEDLPLKGMQANVRIDGFRARVVLDLYYFNDRAREFEGTFKLRLPNEASPFMFAFGESVLVAGGPPDEPRFILDKEGLESLTVEEVMRSRAETWENVKEARMVPREKAAFAYTETVRRRIDPALMEWSGAGVFSARVFPLRPRKLHRIVIGYDVDLLQAGDDLVYTLDLPSAVKRRVVDVDLAELKGVAVEVTPQPEAKVRGAAKVRGTRTDSADGAESEHVPLRPVRASGRVHYRYENPDERTITVRQKSPGTIMLVGKDEKTGSYFATRFRPELPKATVSGPTPVNAAFLVDTSLSSNPVRFNIWLKLMQAILNNNRNSIKKFGVLFFNIEQHWWPPMYVDNTPENAAKCVEYAEGIALEGATDLEAALRRVATSLLAFPKTQYFLLSDGAATWGESDLNAIAKSAPIYPVFAYTTGLAGTDTRALRHLARETGGAVFSVVGEAEVEAASKAHRSRPWRITDCGMSSAEDVLLAGRPRTVFPGQTLTLTGRIGGDPAPLGVLAALLAFQKDSTKRAVLTPVATVIESNLAPRIYGQVATGQIEEFHKLDEATEEVAAAYSRHFRVTGQTCSLLMLESEADYKRFDIKPQEDAFVVKSSPASDVVAKALKGIGDALADAKRRFIAWLTRMEKMPGFKFEVPTALKLALGRMPRSSFEVAPKPLRCNLRKWDEIPGAIQEMLASKKLDYDAITKEAERRLGAGGHVPISGRDRNRYVSPENVPVRSEHAPPAADALKALSSLVENSPGDGVLARDVGFSAVEWGLASQAYHLFRRVAASRPYEPQTYHALARVLESMGKADLAMAYYEIGLAGKWHSRFGEFRKIHGLDYLRFLRRIDAGPQESGLRTSVLDYAKARLQTIGREFAPLVKGPLARGTPGGAGADLVVTITWNTDSTDIDLHVIEPTGEECYYEHRDTKIGGHMTEDVTQGYGPEMYVLSKAVPGTYRVRAKFYSENRQRASARTKVYATIYEKWGAPDERVTRKVVPLVAGKEMRDVATVVVKK